MFENALTMRNVSYGTKITYKMLVSAGLITLAVILPQLVHIMPETILTDENSASEPVSENHILIAYFSNPQADGTDADSSASRNLN